MFSQAEWTAEIQHPIFVKLYSELNAFSVFLLEKTPTVWVKSSTVKLHNDGCFFFKMKQKSFLFHQGWSEINLGAKIFQKNQIYSKNDETTQSVAAQWIEWFLACCPRNSFSLKLIKFVKWNQTRNACGTRLSRIGRRLLPGNFGPKTGKM